MKFDDQYTNKGDWQDKTILPFFGFQHSTKSHYYHRTISVRDETSRTGYTPVTRPESDTYTTYTRKGPVSPEEEEFLSLYKCSDVWSTRYIPTSLKEFYNQPTLSVNIFLMSILFPLALNVFGFLSNSFSELNIGETILASIILAAIGLSAGLRFDAWLGDVIAPLKDKRKKPYKNLTEAELTNLREKYFKEIVRAYGEKAGAILCQFATKHGYDLF